MFLVLAHVMPLPPITCLCTTKFQSFSILAFFWLKNILSGYNDELSEVLKPSYFKLNEVVFWLQGPFNGVKKRPRVQSCFLQNCCYRQNFHAKVSQCEGFTPNSVPPSTAHLLFTLWQQLKQHATPPSLEFRNKQNACKMNAEYFPAFDASDAIRGAFIDFWV